MTNLAQISLAFIMGYCATFVKMKFFCSENFLLNKLISATTKSLKSLFFYYIKIFAYEIKNDRGGQNIDFVEKKFFWKFLLLSKFSLEVRRSLKFRQILKILIFKDYFLTHAIFLLTKYFSKFCHFFILLHKFQNFQKNFKILNFFSKFSKFLQNLSEICQNWFIKSIFCLNLQN